MASTQTDRFISPNVSNEDKRQLCSRLTLQTAHLGQILIYTFAKKTREDQTPSRLVIDAWADTILAQFRAMPAGACWYHLNDFSTTDMNPSPYFVARVREITRNRPDLKGYSAIVIPKNIFTQAMFNLAQRVRPKHINVRLFFNRTEALQWLEHQLESAPTTEAAGSSGRR
jgi:hypothetical protein